MSRKTGLTMIELVSALALFVIIFAMLMSVFRMVTRLWLPEQSSKQLQARSETVMDILANDFYQAVADKGIVPDEGEMNRPSFVLDCPMDMGTQPTVNATTDTPQTVLQTILRNAQITPNASTRDDAQVVLCFTRHASPRTPLSDEDPSQRISLDAVFYVCYSNCLSRHVYPLVRDSWVDNAEDTASALLIARGKQLATELSAKLNWYRGGEPPSEGQHSLLADRCDFAILATLPPAVLSQPPFVLGSIAEPAPDPSKPLNFFWLCEALAVPDFLDVAIILYNDEDWNTRAALQNDNTPRADLKREFLGVRSSKRITFPAKRGAGL